MNEQIKLHDIKALSQIPDYSIFLYYGLIFLIVLVLLLLILTIFKYFNNKKPNMKKVYLKELEDIDYSESKTSAYKLTKLIRALASSDREKKLAHEIIDELEKYKYKKEVKKIDEKIKGKISIFIGMIDV